MSEKRVRVIEERCVGCKICELACSMVHNEGAFNPRNALIRVESNREVGMNKLSPLRDFPHLCLQCEPCMCIESCSADAFRMNENLGIMYVEQDVCIGCQQCITACPHDMIIFNHESKTAMKCDLCGGNPVCVRYCPTDALTFE